MRVQAAVVTLLLGAYVGLALWNAATTSPTVDEPVHLAAGYTYLASRDYRLNPEHPPLVKMVAAIPVVVSGEFEVDPESGAPGTPRADATRSNRVLENEWGALAARADNWRFVHELFYGVRDAVLEKHGVERALQLPTSERYGAESFLHDSQSLMFRARVATLGFGVILGLLIFAWARAWFGFAPAAVALALFSFDPNFIAHGALVTTDVAAAAGIFASVWSFVRALTGDRWVDHLAFALAIALSAIVKFSTVVLGPMLLLAGVAWIVVPGIADDGYTPRVRLLRVVRLLGIGALAAWTGIWCAYGFRFDATSSPADAARHERAEAPHVIDVPFREPGRLPIEWYLRRAAVIREQVAHGATPVSPRDLVRLAREVRLPAVDRIVLGSRDRRLLPESYLMGLAHLRLSVNRGAFLNGRYSSSGFRDYFLWTFLYKTSIPALILVLAALSGIARGRATRELVLLLGPAVIYLGFAVGAGLNIGHRHILPIYPFLYVATGFLVARWPENRRVVGSLVAAGGVALSCFVAFAPLPGSWIAPHHLSYFNEIAGGPSGGVRRLVDSNCDWGQDLPALRDWVDDNSPDTPIQLSYFGSGDPRAFGIASIDVTNVDPRGLTGLIAVSATNRVGVLWVPERRMAWQAALADAELVGRAGYSILIYRRPGSAR